MSKNIKIDHTQVDWDHIDEIWYVRGFGIVELDESYFASRGKLNWTVEDMNNVFLNKAEIKAKHPFTIKWEAFEEKYGALVFRLGRSQILKAVLAFSKDETSIQATYDFYEALRETFGVQLADHGDEFSSILPDFFYDKEMTAADFFFDYFLPQKLRIHSMRSSKVRSMDGAR